MSKIDIENELSATLDHTLVPVKTPEAFRAHLRSNLELAGRQRKLRTIYRPRRLGWKNWWLAVVAFTASIAAGSVIAYVVRTRLAPPRTL